MTLKASIIARPSTFDRVDRVKEATGGEVLPGDETLWILGDDLIVDIADTLVIVPRGFTTDGASIPRFGRRLTGWGPWDPPQRWAAIIHDWQYCVSGTSKRLADRAFRAALKSEGASWVKRRVMFVAVVVGGGPAFVQDQKQGPRIFP